MLKIDLSDLPAVTNPAYYPSYLDDNRYLVLYGGANSGKSVFAAQKLLVRLLTEPGHRFLVARKVANTLRNSCYRQLADVVEAWGLGEVARFNRSELSATIAQGEVIFAGLDDVEKLKSIAGVTGVWIEEASELASSDFHQLDLRIRGRTPHYKQIILTFNPISEHNWLKARFFDSPDPRATVLKTTYKDNLWATAEDAAILEGLIDRDHVYHQVYTLGNWGILGNLVYTNWEVREIEGEWDTMYAGLDFGFNNPSALVLVAEGDGFLYVAREFAARGLTNAELIEAVLPLLPAGTVVTADSAEPMRIEEFRRAGVAIEGARKGHGSVLAGISYVRGKKLVVNPACVTTIRELRGYKWREDRNGRVHDTPAAYDDHAMDALRYAVEPLISTVGPVSAEVKALFGGGSLYA